MYYQCSGGHRFENQKCPKDLLFNGEVCDWADSKKAQRNCRGKWYPGKSAKEGEVESFTVDEASAEDSYTVTDADGVEVVCGGDMYCPTGIYGHAWNCNKYFQCWEGDRKEDQKCPKGLHFNRKYKYCDYPEQAGCGRSAQQEAEVETVVEEQGVEAASSYCPTGIYRHAFRCNMFFQCWEGDRKENQKCPKGLLFSIRNGFCDWPENVHCH